VCLCFIVEHSCEESLVSRPYNNCQTLVTGWNHWWQKLFQTGGRGAEIISKLGPGRGAECTRIVCDMEFWIIQSQNRRVFADSGI